MLALHLFVLLEKPGPGLKATAYLASLLLSPLALRPLTGSPLSVVLVAPLLVSLDGALRSMAGSWALGVELGRGRGVTRALKALGASSLSVLLLSVAISNTPLLLSSLLVLLYLASAFAYSLRGLDRVRIDVRRGVLRVLAGREGGTKAVLCPEGPTRAYVQLRSRFPWMKIAPDQAELEPGEPLELSIRVRPPLAAPINPVAEAVLVDPRGLVAVRRELSLVDLYVVPKARYAEWLAVRFLRGIPEELDVLAVGSRKEMPVSFRTRAFRSYYGSRPYVPGDDIRDIDWKKSAKLRKLIVKEYAALRGNPAIVVTCLTAEDEEEADDLCYKLVMTVLTMAGEGVPIAVVAYDAERVAVVWKADEPEVALRKVLTLTKHITMLKSPGRVLSVPDPGLKQLRRLVYKLEREGRPTLRSLRDLLALKHKALEEAARGRPAYEALVKCTSLIPPPALVVIISPLSHDAEAVIVGAEKIEASGYRTVLLHVKHGGTRP